MPPEDPKLPSLPHDLAAPETFLPGTPWWHYALIALVILLILTPLIIFLVKKLRRPNLPALPPQDYLAKALTFLDNIDTALPSGEVATHCSLTIRGCIHNIYREQILFETDEEIKLRPDSLAKAPEALRPDIILLLEKLGEEKYAPTQVNEERSQEWIEKSSNLLSDLKKAISSTAAPN